MPIQPKPLNETETVSVRFPKHLLDQLDAYCKYLGGASDRSYVIVESVREVVERDKDFQKSLRKTEPAERPAAAVPPAADKDRKPQVTPVAPAKERAV
jgi:Arc/MetJ-type ribon-helix-helix transcriptional regulator